MPLTKTREVTFVDTHVHLHPAVDIRELLNVAIHNISNAVRIPGRQQLTGILCLAEPVGINRFSSIYRKVKSDEGGFQNELNPWHLTHTAEAESLRASRDGHPELILIAGRQIVTQERLEVLALLTQHQFRDGLSLLQTVDQILSKGGAPVVPWGAGKWAGQRGRVLRTLLYENNLPLFFLGDNGGRPSIGKEPALFKAAKQRDVRILRGSDPLNLPHETDRIGSYGFFIHKEIDKNKPARALKQLLSDRNIDITDFGNLMPTAVFLKNQLSIRLARPSFFRRVNEKRF